MYERILVPLDSSKLADVVLPYAELLAGALDSEVTLMYVCEPKEKQYQRVHEFYLGKIAKLVKSHIREQHPGKRGASIEVKSVVLCGKPSEEISNYAHKNSANLIVMARSGRSGIMRRLMAQIADRVFQATRIPLLLITAKPYPEPGPLQLMDRILLPLDGSESHEAALPYITELTKRLKADVFLLRVVTRVHQVRTTHGTEYVRFTEQQLESMKATAEQYLENVGRKLADTKAIPNYEVRIADDTATEIVNFARENDVRLIAISTHRHSAIRQWLAGSIVHKILQAADKPILLVKVPS